MSRVRASVMLHRPVESAVGKRGPVSNFVFKAYDVPKKNVCHANRKTPPATLPAIPTELLEQFGNGPMTAEAINAATMALKKALIEQALGAVFPATTLQTCVVHLIRNSLDYASWKDRKGLAAAIKPIYTAPSAEAAQAELEAFAEGPWGQRFPPVSTAWRNAWDRVIPFFAFPPEIRKVIYTTNAIENINSQLRKIIKTRGHFATDDAATKHIWLALRNITADWGRAAKDWKAAMNQFAILYADRFDRPSV